MHKRHYNPFPKLTYATGQIEPTVCVRCKTLHSAQGFYSTGRRTRIGICRKHKSHAGGKIFWYV